MEELVKVHGKNLAQLFVSKSGTEEVEATKDMVKEIDAKYEAALDASAREIAMAFENQRAAFSGHLNTIGSTVNAKADTAWLEQLEANIRWAGNGQLRAAAVPPHFRHLSMRLPQRVVSA